MLGCQDFCGYYEWTFHYLRRNFGRHALEKYWANAIAADAQKHYIESGQQQGLRGLYESWLKTGDDEQCDWTVTLDEDHNLLRLDMRECPSKGFLLENDLNADEDYCDHCIGWIGPALHKIGAEVAAHEHNHCGQCWWEIRGRDREQPLVQLTIDICTDQRWGRGYLHRFVHHKRQPTFAEEAQLDPCDFLEEWFRRSDKLIVLGDGSDARWLASMKKESRATIVSTGQQYVTNAHFELVDAVLLDHDVSQLAAVAERYHASEAPPLLMHCYLPGQPKLNFREHNLPRAVPILPLLIRSRAYVHKPAETPPSTLEFIERLAVALRKRIIMEDR